MRIRYGRYDPSSEDLEASDLMDWIKDFFTQSGFSDPQSRYRPDPEHNFTLEELAEALRQALEERDLLPQDGNEAQEMLEQLIQKLADQGWIRIDDPEAGAGAGIGEAGSPQFELTNRSADFLGLKSLRDLLGGMGRSLVGAHPTPYYAPGAERSGEIKSWEFGDPLNLAVSDTLRRVAARGIESLSEDDLLIEMAEYTASMSTVVLLDCSHSMILYGEDRFTPAKQVALALSHLIRTQYPGDEVHFGVFHDSAEEVPLAKLPLVQVGPYHTNTKGGLALARKILKKSGKSMRQIIMITDGKPSAITLPNGQIYKNSWGLDATVLNQTMEEVVAARSEGIPIHTFMLARDPELVAFVRKVSEITRGKAYFTTPFNLGQYILMDFLNRKVHQVN